MTVSENVYEFHKKDLPAQNKDNFRIYHEQDTEAGARPSVIVHHRSSNYPTTPDTPLDERIVNEPKPQVTLNYLRIRGSQYSSSKISAKRTKVKI